MLISINRTIFNALQDERIKKMYIEEIVRNESTVSDDEYIEEKLTGSEIESVTDGVFRVITKNEECISKHGMEKYLNDEIPIDDYVSGYYYNSGKVVICPFDWAVDENNEFDYSFTLARVI